MRAALAILLMVPAAACTRPVPAPAVQSRTPPARVSLASADALVRAGCLDCLMSAFAAYEALLSDPTVAADARRGAIAAGILVAVRERELGIEETDTLAKARALADESLDLPADLRLAFDVFSTLPVRYSATNRIVAGEAQLAAARRVAANRDAWTDELRADAAISPGDAYLWLAFSCVYGDARAANVTALAEAASAWRDTPLVRYRIATCRELQLPELQRLVADDPRFHEIRYSLALKAILEGRLDDADADLTSAYEFRARWPAVTFAIADVALTGEDFARAADFFERTLALVPDDPEAAVGRARSLTYLARFEEAIAAASGVLALERGYTGEALYWRAMAESELGRQDEAWEDVQQAERLITNADVPKLAGIVESRRGERVIARQKLELAHDRNRFDCQTMFYFGSVVAEQRDWQRSVEVFSEDADCFVTSERGLDEAIRRIDESNASPERKARLIARRRQQRASAAQDLVTCWFNLAAANFNLRRYAEARDNAGKVGEDPRYASRVRELLGLIPN